MADVRDDVELQHDVVDELDFEPGVDASNIGVAVSDGVVTLTGTVPTYTEKIAAEKAAKRVFGVQGIANELKVELPQAHVRTDTDIAKAAINVLNWDTAVPRGVTLSVSNGFVTLTGEVDWQFQKDRARMLVQSIVGVRGVSNLITVKPKISESDVKTKIRQAFERSADIDADHIQIETHDHTVTLRGTVHSWFEREEATRAAYAVPGVTSVENLTRVA
jgi:osmotically-inducible protein OsmY